MNRIEPQGSPRTCVWAWIPGGETCSENPVDRIYTEGIDPGHHFVAALCAKHRDALFHRTKTET